MPPVSRSTRKTRNPPPSTLQVTPPPAGGAEDAGLVGVCTESTSFYAEAGGQVAGTMHMHSTRHAHAMHTPCTRQHSTRRLFTRLEISRVRGRS